MLAPVCTSSPEHGRTWHPFRMPPGRDYLRGLPCEPNSELGADDAWLPATHVGGPNRGPTDSGGLWLYYARGCSDLEWHAGRTELVRNRAHGAVRAEQMLAARGTRVCVAAQGKATRLRELGAAEVIDHNEQSFMSVLAERRNRPLDAVLDCVGAEDVAAAQLQQQAGASYVSLASPGLTTLLERGALAGFSAQMRSWRRQQQPETDTDAPARVWEADETAAEALREVLAFIEAGTVVPPAEANGAAELMECYLEHVTWARDAETGLRFGFPGKSMWPSAPQAPRWDRGLPE